MKSAEESYNKSKAIARNALSKLTPIDEEFGKRVIADEDELAKRFDKANKLENE